VDPVHTGTVIPIATLRAVNGGDATSAGSRRSETGSDDPSRRPLETDADPDAGQRPRDLRLIALALQLTDSDHDETATLRGVFARLLDETDAAAEVPVQES
jgi:hypothetical protein